MHLLNSMLKPRHIGICQAIYSLDAFLPCAGQAKRGNSAVSPLQNLGQKRQYIRCLRCISRISAIPLLADNRGMMLLAVACVRTTCVPNDETVGSGARFAGSGGRIVIALQRL